MIQVDYYHFEDGTNPIDPYLDTLEPKKKAKMLRTISLLKEFGTSLREPYSKPMGDGIFELRSKQGNQIDRVMYFFFYNGQAILTNGYTKKQPKTPKAEIELAKQRRDDFLRRHQNG